LLSQNPKGLAMRLPTLHSKRLIGARSMACAGLAAAAVSLALTTLPAAAAATAPACTASQLVVWLNSTGSAAAGSTFYAIQFTNISATTCSMVGYPGVSGLNHSDTQLGSAASRNPEHKSFSITLAGTTTSNKLSNTAIAIVKVTDVLNFPKAKCGPVMAAALRVYPPGLKSSSVVPFPFRACSKSGAPYLSVESVEGGVAAA
jgi:hypothetical protein